MPKLPILKPREVVSILNHLGFAEIRQPLPQTVSPFGWQGYDGSVSHWSRHLTSLLRKIIEDIRLTPEEFVKLV